MRVLLTGAAGFIGFHLARHLAARGDDVLGIDSLNSYYEPQLKHDRLAQLKGAPGFRFAQADIADPASLKAAVAGFAPEEIVHLAAQAGVRYSIEGPIANADANVRGHISVLELARTIPGLRRVLHASSSSVYGRRIDVPFRETDRCDAPTSVYAATKRAGELISKTFASLYPLSLTGLRFFTVYGPWGRPGMAYWTFTEKVLRSEPIPVFNEGRMRRDFTDVRGIIAGLARIVDAPAAPGHAIYNIGHSEPVELSRFIAALEALPATMRSAISCPFSPATPPTPASMSRSWSATSA